MKTELMKNKLYALALEAIGASTLLLTDDGTAFVMLTLLSVPMFFSKKSWIY